MTQRKDAWITEDEAAELALFGIRSLRYHRKNGSGPCFRLNKNGSVRYRLSSVRSFAHGYCYNTTPQKRTLENWLMLQEMELLLTTQSAADSMGVSRRTLETWRRWGRFKGPTFVWIGKTVYYLKWSVDKFSQSLAGKPRKRIPDFQFWTKNRYPTEVSEALAKKRDELKKKKLHLSP